jgi:hypothetical protein
MRRSLLLLGSSLLLGGCIIVKIDPSKPIEVHVKVDVTVDKALDDFFGDLDKKSATLTTAPAKP